MYIFKQTFTSREHGTENFAWLLCGIQKWVKKWSDHTSHLYTQPHNYTFSTKSGTISNPSFSVSLDSFLSVRR